MSLTLIIFRKIIIIKQVSFMYNIQQTSDLKSQNSQKEILFQSLKQIKNKQNQTKSKQNKEVKDVQGRINNLENNNTNLAQNLCGREYMTVFLNISSRFSTIFKEAYFQDKFTLKSIIFSEQLTQQIAQAIIHELKSNPNQSRQEDQKQIDVWNINKETVQLINFSNMLKSIQDYIQDKEKNLDVNGDFDIIIKQLLKFSDQTEINKIFQKMSVDKSQNCWIIPDFLQTSKAIKEENKENDQTLCRYIFELKSNPFNQLEFDEKDDDKQKDKKRRWTNKYIKGSPKKSNNPDNKISSSKQQKEQIPHQQNGTNFQKILLENLSQNNMLEVVSQIVKLVYGAIHYFFAKEISTISKNSFVHYFQNRSLNKKEFDLRFNTYPHPPVIIYFVLNNKISRKDFEEKFSFVKPFLKHIFLKCKAVFNVIGFTKQNYDRNDDLIFKLQIQMEQQSRAMKQRSRVLEQQSRAIEQQSRAIEQRSRAMEQQQEIRKKQIQNLKNQMKKMSQELQSFRHLMVKFLMGQNEKQAYEKQASKKQQQ